MPEKTQQDESNDISRPSAKDACNGAYKALICSSTIEGGQQITEGQLKRNDTPLEIQTGIKCKSVIEIVG